jgi:hypothetical protein
MAGDSIVSGPKFIGLYWTNPVPWAGFTKLPSNADAAAAKSRTVRYQRDLVCRYVTEEKGTLLDEIVFLETQPDRWTSQPRVRRAVERAIRGCEQHGAQLLYIDFREARGWRPHYFIVDEVQRLGIPHLALPPLRQVVLSDGNPYDPVEHFRRWRERYMRADERHARALEGLRTASPAIPSQRGRYRLIAEWLNEAGYRTKTGRRWEPDNVKAAMRVEEIP